MNRPDLRPLPIRDSISAPFWEAADGGRLDLQRCSRCATFQHPPRPVCHRCLSGELVWTEVDPIVTIESWTTIRAQAHPAFPVPYVIAVGAVDGAAPVRLVGNVLGCDPEEVGAGVRARVVFERLADGTALPQFDCGSGGSVVPDEERKST